MGQEIDFIAQFHAYLLTEKRVSENTFLAYKRDVAQLDNYLKSKKVTLDGCQKKHLTNFLKHLKDAGFKAKTLSRKISSIKLLFDFVHERYKLSNSASGLIFPKLEKKLPAFLSEQEVQALLVAASSDVSDKGTRNKVMLSLLYATGMRVSELVSLTVDQLYFDTGFIKLSGKGNKERFVPLPKSILSLLRFYLDVVYPKLLLSSEKQNNKENYLFFTLYKKTIKSLSRQSFWIILKKILKKALIVKNISPHSLRHSLATHLLKNGADLRSLQILLGHENLATVQVYTHLGDSELRKIYDKNHPRA